METEVVRKTEIEPNTQAQPTTKATENEEGSPFDVESSPPAEIPYTTFSRRQLWGLQLLLGLATITSPLTATIYFPLLPLLRERFNTTAQAINLTLTVYIIFQAISPVIFGPLSDTQGRRPLFLVTLALYVVGNIGLAANQDSYAVLLVLRAVQSLGASAAYAISFGVVADVCVPSGRGRMLGPISMALNLGACVGPVTGGLVAYTSGDYVWVFWALVIIGGVLLVGVGFLLPETARSLVGNGDASSPRKWWQRSWWSLIKSLLRRSSVTRTTRGMVEDPPQPKEKGFRLANILASFRIVFYRDTFLILWLHGSFYTVDYSFVAATPDIFKDVYHFNDLQVGLAYLPRGIGIIIGSYFTGRLMDLNYHTVARRAGLTVDKVAGDDLLQFPIERARSRGSYWMLLISTGTMVAYGWTAQAAAHPAVPLALQFMQGFWGTFFYTTYSTLLVDGFPKTPSTAAAATSITRCAMAAAGVAVLQPLLDRAGRGWYFTVLGLWSGLFGIGAVALIRWKGMKWRRLRKGLDRREEHPP